MTRSSSMCLQVPVAMVLETHLWEEMKKGTMTKITFGAVGLVSTSQHTSNMSQRTSNISQTHLKHI